LRSFVQTVKPFALRASILTNCDSLVDEGCGWVLWLNSWLVGLNGSSETSCVRNVVHDACSSIDVAQSVASGLTSQASSLASETSTAGVVLIVSEGVVAS